MVSGQIQMGKGKYTYRSGSLTILHLEVISGDQRAQARARDVFLQDPRAHADVGAGQVGRRRKGRGLGVKEDNVAVRAGSFGGSGSGVVGAIYQYYSFCLFEE